MNPDDDPRQPESEERPFPPLDPFFTALSGLAAAAGVFGAIITGKLLWLPVGLSMGLVYLVAAFVGGVPQSVRYSLYPHAIRLVIGILLGMIVAVLATFFL